MNCPFELTGQYKLVLGGWQLVVVNDTHNHEASQHLEGHSMAMKMTEEEVGFVRQMSKQKMQPRNILSEIKKKNPDNVSVPRTLYNVIQRINRENRTGDTPMQVFFSLLTKREYSYVPRFAPGTNRTDGIFFVHKESYKWWRAFPHVLGIDATYNTNVYKMPYVQMVGVTSTGVSFLVASTFLSKEREDNFTWMLAQLKDSIADSRLEPTVIITDRDMALVKACETVFPKAKRNLCRWHIEQNIFKHCNQGFDGDGWNRFTRLWAKLLNSSTPVIYHYHYDKLYRELAQEHPSKFHLAGLIMILLLLYF